MDGADERNRTSDLLITNQLLYRLSYIGIMESGIVSKIGKKVFLRAFYRAFPPFPSKVVFWYFRFHLPDFTRIQI